MFRGGSPFFRRVAGKIYAHRRTPKTELIFCPGWTKFTHTPNAKFNFVVGGGGERGYVKVVRRLYHFQGHLRKGLRGSAGTFSYCSSPRIYSLAHRFTTPPKNWFYYSSKAAIDGKFRHSGQSSIFAHRIDRSALNRSCGSYLVRLGREGLSPQSVLDHQPVLPL